MKREGTLDTEVSLVPSKGIYDQQQEFHLPSSGEFCCLFRKRIWKGEIKMYKEKKNLQAKERMTIA